MNGWTPERRRRQSELIKSWRPWEKSTGAKTPEGKKRSSQNALKHGGRSAEAIAMRRMMAQMERQEREARKMITDIGNMLYKG